jgi:hypothetical protein
VSELVSLLRLFETLIFGMVLGKDCVVTTRTIKRPSVEPLCQWVKTMLVDVSRNNGEHGNEPSGSIKCWDYFLSGCLIGSFSRRAQLHE